MAEIAFQKVSAATANATTEKTEFDETRANQPLMTATPSTKVVLTGPYGASHVDQFDDSPGINVQLIAGGTGITFVLPVLFHLMTAPTPRGSANRKIELIWVVRKASDVAWVQPELETLNAACERMNLVIRIFVTREERIEVAATHCSAKPIAIEQGCSLGDEIQPSSCSQTGSSNPSSLHKATAMRTLSETHVHHRPCLRSLINAFVEATISGPTIVYASGPQSMITDVRRSVAEQNSASKVWRGDERARVELIADDRVEW
jgi:ferric-chelate reductase